MKRLASILCFMALPALSEPLPPLAVDEPMAASSSANESSQTMFDDEYGAASGEAFPEEPMAASGSDASAEAESDIIDDDRSPPSMAAVEVYDPEILIEWINQNRHLQQVQDDDCQLVQDIEARAKRVALPSYEFLWGDMLAWGVCVERDAELGMEYMWRAAKQGLAAAMEQIGRYYAQGILVQQDIERALPLLREASAQGFLKAQLLYVELLLEAHGSPYDYEDAYRWLHHAVIVDKATHQKAASLLAQLAHKMPQHIVRKARMSNQPY